MQGVFVAFTLVDFCVQLSNGAHALSDCRFDLKSRELRRRQKEPLTALGDNATKTITFKLSQRVLACLVYFDDRKTVKKADYGR